MKIVPTELHDLGPCPCCAEASRLVVGRVDHEGTTDTEYSVHMTDGPMHEPCAAFYIIFPGGIAVALEVVAAGPGDVWAALINANTAPVAEDPDVVRALPAAEVYGTPLADRAEQIVDAAMSEDPHLRAFAARGDEERACAVWSRRLAASAARSPSASN